MTNPARKTFEPMLSPYVDGELTPEERQLVEQHLASCKESADQVADFRAMSGLIRHTLDQAADEVDFKQLTNDVMARLTPEKLPLLERLKLSVAELFRYQKAALGTGFALATAAAAVAVVVLQGGGRVGYGQETMKLQTVKVEQGATVQPVVFETSTGDAIIWVPEESQKKDEKTTDEAAEELGIDKVDEKVEKQNGEL